MRSVEANRNAPAFAEDEANVNAPIETVWRVLSDFEKWPAWNESVSEMKLLGPVEENTEFHWIAGGMKIKSRIESVEIPKRIVWSGKTMGIRAIHAWELSEVGTSTKVHTEESFQGLIVRLFSGRMKKELIQALKQGLGALKKEAERRHGERRA